MSNAIAILSNVRVISSALFTGLTPAKQTAILAIEPTKPVVFVPTFEKLRDKKALVAKLLSGADVSMELEFNKIEVSSEEFAALRSLKPILERISGLTPNYPWVERKPRLEESVRFSKESFNRGGYNVTFTEAKKIWDKASAFWAGGTNPGRFEISVGGYSNRTIIIGLDQIAIGCQRISRHDVEGIALKMGWEPNV